MCNTKEEKQMTDSEMLSEMRGDIKELLKGQSATNEHLKTLNSKVDKHEANFCDVYTKHDAQQRELENLKDIHTYTDGQGSIFKIGLPIALTVTCGLLTVMNFLFGWFKI